MPHEDILEKDIFQLLAKLPYAQTEEDAAVEKLLVDYEYSKLFDLDEATADAVMMVSQEVYIGDAIEKAKGLASTTQTKLKNAAGVLGNFVRSLQRMTINKIANEKFIRKRFEGLKASYINFFYNGVGDRHAYVEAPTYDTMAKRLMGLDKCVRYLIKAANFGSVSNNIDNDTYAKLVDMSDGCLSVKSSSSGLVNHLVWNPPTIEKWNIIGSKLAKPENINNLCNTVLYVKYETMKGVEEAVKVCMKTTKRLADTADGLVSYDVEEETAEKYMHDYGAAYMMSKMLRDLVKQGIQREINTLVINYIHKLKAIKSETI